MSQPRPEDKKISVTIKSRKKTVFDGKAISISSINDKGPFDILASHANFITMVRDYIRVAVDENNFQDIVIKVGVMRVFENNVQVYLTVV